MLTLTRDYFASTFRPCNCSPPAAPAAVQISLAALATLPGTSITQVADPSGWDRIVVRDVSGAVGTARRPST